MKTMRTFIAIEIPEIIRKRIADFQEELRGARASVSWTKPQNIHVTLKFLGDVEESNLSGIVEAVKETALPNKVFTIEVAGQGGFPSMRRPRVLWVGIGRGSKELKQVAEMLEERLEPLGFESEKRKYTPHLTIGRVKSQSNIGKMADIIGRTSIAAGSFSAKKIVIMKSILHPTGAIYTPYAQISLGAGQNTNIITEESKHEL